MNSAYGALLNKSFKYGRKELGASVTACGRQITTHMLETIHSLLSDEPAKLVKMTEVDDDGTVSNVYTIKSNFVTYSDTDSVVGESLIYANNKLVKIEDLYNSLTKFEYKDDFNKSYVKPAKEEKITTLCSDGKTIVERPINYVMKHRVKKEMFEITVGNKSVIVTEDHSVMVIRKNKLVTVKAKNIKHTDKLINIETPIDLTKKEPLYDNTTIKYDTKKG